ncbi:LPXTG cell wall anchor domain-containing protein [Agreia sp. Leaf283]|uniref:LPXTG cell wall anchor domain-containing protein n=1 Tax=Agreia sp. Leaf283 TaxID=1736321 RepID=UPI0006F622B4|nr:LPXTG cell wall anchor domain-containing protein [Agreia sp. Leaf283]KQP56619.1 hypothetical protein ASF51_01460 [Agreia sp. Leaf283]
MIDRPAAARRVTGLLAVAAALAGGLVAANPLGAPLAASGAEAAPGILTISASASRIAQGDRAFISVHRSGGADGVVGVSVDSQALPAELASVIAPIDTQVTFLDRDTADKVIPIVFLGDVPGGLPGSGDVPSGGEVPPGGAVPPGGGDAPPSDPTDAPGLGGASARAATSVVADHAVARALAAAEVGSAPFTVSLSAPTGGAVLGTPSSVSLLVATPPTTTPVDGGSDSGGSSTGGTTTPGSATPGSSTKNSTGTTSPVGGDRSLAHTGADVMLPFIGATLAAILGLAAVLFVRRRRTPESS